MSVVGVIVPYSPRHTPSEFLDEALESVGAQSVQTETYVIRDEDQRGPAWARNQGLERASERYIAFLDADDVWRDHKLERQMAKMESEDSGICVEGDPALSTAEFIRDLFVGNITSITSSILIDTGQVSTRFEETLPRKEDHLFVLESASDAGVCLCPDLVRIRKHEDGLSAQGDSQLEYRARRQFVELARQRVPEIEPYFERVAAPVWFGSGRQFHYRGEYARALRAFWKSWQYRPSPLILPAVGMVFCHWISPVHPLGDGEGDVLTRIWKRYNRSPD